VSDAQTWTLIGTVVALSASLVSVVIAFMTSRFNEFQRQFDDLGRRFGIVEGRLDRVEGRLDRVEGRLDGLDRDVQTLVRHITGDDAPRG
jgi:hypothetical protein